MQHDLNLVLEILLEVRKRNGITLRAPKYDEKTVSRHVDLLLDAGYIESRKWPVYDDYADRLARLVREARGWGEEMLVLTPRGQQLVKAASNIFVWKIATERLLEKGRDVTLVDLEQALPAALRELDQRINDAERIPAPAGCSKRQLALWEKRRRVLLPESLKDFLNKQNGGQWPSTQLTIFPLQAAKHASIHQIGDLTHSEWDRVTTDERGVVLDRKKLILVGLDESSGGLVVLNYDADATPTVWWLWRDIGDVLRKAAPSFDEFLKQQTIAAHDHAICRSMMQLAALLKSIKTEDDARLQRSALKKAILNRSPTLG